MHCGRGTRGIGVVVWELPATARRCIGRPEGYPADAAERIATSMEGRVLRAGAFDRLVGVAEHRSVKLPARVGIGYCGFIPHERSGLVVDLRADVTPGLPYPEDGALRVQRDAHPARTGHVEGA